MGDSSRLVLVRCPDHHETLVKGLWNLFAAQYGVDFDFPSGMTGTRQTIRAHRLIVEVFMSSDTVSQASIETVAGAIESTDGVTNLDYLIEFMYKGQVAVHQEQLGSLLRVAQELNFKMLADALAETKGSETVEVEGAVTTCALVAKSGSAVTRGSRQRKGRPVKLKSSEVKVAVKGEREEAWRSSASKRLRPTRARMEVGLLAEQSSGEDKWNDESESGASDEEKAVPTTPRRAKAKVARKVVSRGAARRQVGRPPTKKLRQPTLKCGHCTYKTYCKTRYQVHAAQHDPSIVIFRCGTCSKPFLTSEAFEVHKLSHTCEPKIFKCPHCQYQTSKKVAHQIHLAKHDSSVAVHKCATCFRPFSCRESLERHQQRHRVYHCPHCEFTTPKGGSYHHHLRSVHKVNTRGDSTLKRFCCTDCSKTYMYASELKYHVLAMHSGEKPFRCPQCPYSTGRKVDVARHIKVAHLNIKPYMCELCGFRAVTPFNLERHKVSHSGLKPYKCEACGQAFADRDTLKRHARLHIQNEKPFICHMCAHGFNRRHNLKVHLKNVHKTPMEEPDTFKA